MKLEKLAAIFALTLRSLADAGTTTVGGGESLVLDGPSQSILDIDILQAGLGATPDFQAQVSVLNGAALVANQAILGTSGSVDSPGDSLIAVAGAGSRLKTNFSSAVGFNGRGTLTVSSGGLADFGKTVNVPGLIIGYSSRPQITPFPDTGEVIVTDPDSRLSTVGQLSVGNRGEGTLIIRNGGQVTSTSEGSPGLYSGVIGIDYGVGHVVVEGVGSRWDQTGAVGICLRTQSVGDPYGDLTIRDGGAVTATRVLLDSPTTTMETKATLTVESSGSLVTSAIELRTFARTTVASDGRIATGALSLLQNAKLNFLGGHLSAGATTYSGTISLSTFTPVLLQLGSLRRPNPTLGSLDIGVGAAAIDNSGSAAQPSTLATITSDVVAGRSGGTWSGLGIRSSAAAADPSHYSLGVATSLETGIESLFAEAVDDSTTLVRFTRLGDSNLDGSVTITDFARLAANFNQPGRWFSGDFDYSGQVNIADFALLAANFGESADLNARATVPEPALPVTAITIACAAGMRRRGQAQA